MLTHILQGQIKFTGEQMLQDRVLTKLTKSCETQQTRARKEFKSLARAEVNNISEKELAAEMTKDMDNPNSASTLIQAATSILYMKAVKNGSTPMTDAVNRCLKKKKTVNEDKNTLPLLCIGSDE